MSSFCRRLIFFAVQNLVTRVLFNPSALFGWVETGGFVDPTLPNSFLLLVMRMGLGVPLIAVMLPPVYPNLWGDLRQLKQPTHRRELWLAVVGGVLMFSYLGLLYVSVGLVATGIALTLFFTFPVYTALLSWWWFGYRPSWPQWGIMAVILIGSGLTIPTDHSSTLSWFGVGFGLLAAGVYAFYTVVAQKAFETLHPLPFTGISFATTLVMSAICLLIWRVDLQGLPWLGLWVGALLSAIATAAGHLLNNLGIRLVGATAAAMVGAANPALTAVLAWLGLQEQLSWVQGLGVGLVTLSVALLSLAKPS
ncbi:MAG: EamA family transporter [Leptolyngbyaceae cyanobacterium SM2_5_2]|nr:EamA family transporter [Leptolyngbyaceae cyanobacterium SM2_5_2]